MIVAVLGKLAFGAVSTPGVGFYAPCITMVSLLGMNPAPLALGLTAGGLAGVPLAAFVVESLPMEGLRWLVIAVVLFAALRMFRSGESE